MAHQHYKGTGKMHSFRGYLADGEQEKIRIQGSVGSIAWRITKFQVIDAGPTTSGPEAVVKIFREQQSGVDVSIDFRNDELLGVAFFKHGTITSQPDTQVIIFDNSLFVRNIWVTSSEPTDNANMNYYIELEEVKVSAAGMAQLAVAAARRTID